ncbi:N-acetyltransferase family protein [Photobacterium profundum]|uniref:GNAT family N-acetyltransferase n=1 Tax=Photobacterium profundum TaxID=74109 RepID=UPI003D1486E0
MDIIDVKTTNCIEKSLIELLTDGVEKGASIGFIAPLGEREALEYWQAVNLDIQNSSRKLFVAITEERVVGAVQLSITHKPNGLHRGEIEKLIVHSEFRGQGISKQLMLSMESTAKQIGRHLLVLDTRLGDIASNLYRKLDYIEAGQIPNFAKSSSGEFEATVYFYKQL